MTGPTTRWDRRRHPIIHGPQPPRRVFMLDPDVTPSVDLPPGLRSYVAGLRHVYEGQPVGIDVALLDGWEETRDGLVRVGVSLRGGP